MSVHVTDTSDPNAWVIVGDECHHTGTAPSSSLSYGKNMDGTDNTNIIVIPCPEPGCGSVSWWPRESLPPVVHEQMTA